MRRAVVLALVLALAFAHEDPTVSKQGEEPTFSGESHVIVLTGANFEETIKQHEKDGIMVEFYAPWCGHCKQFAPDYEMIASSLVGKTAIAKVDATAEENQELAKQYGVQGFPTFRFFVKELVFDYPGARSPKAMTDFIAQCVAGMTEINDYAGLLKFIEEHKTGALIELTESHEGDLHDVAKKFGDFQACKGTPFGFAEVVGVKASEILGDKAPAALPVHLLVPQGDISKAIIYDKEPYNPVDFYQWATVQGLPLLDEVGPENFRFYADTGLPLGWVFLDAKPTDDVRAILEGAAAKLRNKAVFFWIDSVKYSRQADQLAGGKVYPTITITKENDKFVVPEAGAALTEEAIVKFVEEVAEGKVTPFKKSDPVPADDVNPGPVYDVVGLNFKDVAFDKSKDVFVKFYASWCGHCKALEPIYHELAMLLKDTPSIKLTQVNAPQNELNEKDTNGVQIRGFPTLVLYPANNKTPISYEGDRSLSDILSFLKEHASTPINVELKEEPVEEEPTVERMEL